MIGGIGPSANFLERAKKESGHWGTSDEIYSHSFLRVLTRGCRLMKSSKIAAKAAHDPKRQPLGRLLKPSTGSRQTTVGRLPQTDPALLLIRQSDGQTQGTEFALPSVGIDQRTYS
jgi:hypothetical protein